MEISKWLPKFKVSAERDTNIGNYFYDNGVIIKILEKDKWLVLGRKGTGKTALYKYLNDYLKKDNFDNKTIIPFNFSSYPWPVHNLYKETSQNNLNSYKKSWKFLFYSQIFSQLIAKKERNKIKLSSELKLIKSIFKNIYGKPEFAVNDTLKSKLLSIKKISLPGIDLESLDWSLTLGTLEFDDVDVSDDDIKKIRNNVFSLLNYLEKAISKELKDENFIILIDNLDEDWLIENIEQSKLLITNLLSTINEINNNIKGVKIITFLRVDIFEELKFNDKNKFSQDTAIEIKWSKKDLEEMLFSRIIKFAPNEFLNKEKDNVNVLFNYRKVKYNSLPIHYILKQTFFRPRDILVFVNIMSDESQKKRTKTKYFTPEIIYNSENEYSTYLYDEIMDEWSNQKPSISDYLAVIQSIGKPKFKYNEYLITIAQHFAFKEEKMNVSKSKVIEILKFLFSISVVGQVHKGKIIFNVDKPFHQININENFVVNYGLHKRLSI